MIISVAVIGCKCFDRIFRFQRGGVSNGVAGSGKLYCRGVEDKQEIQGVGLVWERLTLCDMPERKLNTAVPYVILLGYE